MLFPGLVPGSSQTILDPGTEAGNDENCESMNDNIEYKMEALLFDCDGVLVDTERDGHRIAFNRARFLQSDLTTVQGAS